MFVRNVLLLCTAAGAAVVFAQTAPQLPVAPDKPAVSAPDGGAPAYIRPETPEQRKARLGTPEDPGTNPDPNKHYWRFGNSYHIEKFDRKWESNEGVEPGYVRPFAFVNVSREIYQRNDKYVWVWMPDKSAAEQAAEAPPETPRYNAEQINYLQDLRSEFSELVPKDSGKALRFEESSEGLPSTGSWRNSLAVADMNEDGCPDLVAPPPRKGNPVPVIFLGDCKGHWKEWTDVKWPRGFDYGSVASADFNKDGHMDLALGVHLTGVVVLLGDGKGNFRESSAGLPADFPTRRVVAADMDHDGYPDLVAISEGPVATSVLSAKSNGKIRVYFNRKKGSEWQGEDLAGADRRTAGDWLTVANLTGDRGLDVIASSIYQNSNDIVYVSDGPKKWKGVNDAHLVPYLSYYSANAAGKISSRKSDDALVAYTRVWPADVPANLIPDPPSKQIIGIDRITLGANPKRTPVIRWPGSREISGMAVGDFDGDGNLDVVFTRYEPREIEVLLGDGKGGFRRATVSGVSLETNPNYDIKVADVNGDGRPDIILMYESSAPTVLAQQNGSVHVFLNRGAAPASIKAEK